MVVKINKRESAHDKERKLKKALVKSKRVKWDKYFGKIKFPIDAIAYQQKMRDEWSK